MSMHESKQSVAANPVDMCGILAGSLWVPMIFFLWAVPLKILKIWLRDEFSYIYDKALSFYYIHLV